MQRGPRLAVEAVVAADLLDMLGERPDIGADLRVLGQRHARGRGR